MKKEYELLNMNISLTEDEECRFYFDIEKNVYETMPRDIKKQIGAHMFIALAEFLKIDEDELIEHYFQCRHDVGEVEVKNGILTEKKYH